MNKPTLAQRLQSRNIPDKGMVIMHHKWRNLLFLHWKVNPATIQNSLPPGLYVDEFNGEAYLGIIPFKLYDISFKMLFNIVVDKEFNEVNVRTYVHDENGTPGVWFYSLDADSFKSVEGARLLDLPYMHARIKNKFTPPDEHEFNVIRKDSPEEFKSTFKYKVEGESFIAESGTLEFFLVERYLLFKYDSSKKNLSSIRVVHQPYPLKQVELLQYDNNLLSLNGFSIDSQPAHAIFSTGVDVDVYY
jgi:uncharacterized protein